ncbi:hypothetical protein DFJ58DRAFT_843543 [Suillus subalutaceus]|uniref:uncharacterized protein n=1 Tax=Suillus subalutaceus TaxID=48586 RepID=UPI001B85C0CE|nr:uncharacterized protein DFJ58DRAFT_843543 [Suillus subalutaceus]KAG1846223.1 hypothetical protein DFJ58DRAFT_843543 [Suillus subalutaceus]
MDSQGPSQGPQNNLKANLQRDYRERERLAFRNLLGALNEVERTNARSRREILRRATECLRRLGQEQVDLQQQLGGTLPNNAAGTGTGPEGGYNFIWLSRNILVSSRGERDGRRRWNLNAPQSINMDRKHMYNVRVNPYSATEGTISRGARATDWHLMAPIDGKLLFCYVFMAFHEYSRGCIRKVQNHEACEWVSEKDPSDWLVTQLAIFPITERFEIMVLVMSSDVDAKVPHVKATWMYNNRKYRLRWTKDPYFSLFASDIVSYDDRLSGLRPEEVEVSMSRGITRSAVNCRKRRVRPTSTSGDLSRGQDTECQD